jgi:leucyl/phenylalanyl-tRNA---protein transferase
MVRLDPQTLLSAYAQGVFPMADHHGDIHFYTADPRGIIPLNAFHIPRTLRQLLRKDPPVFDVRFNYDFRATMTGCMTGHSGGSWINKDLVDAYCGLHDLGFAHSVEAWKENQLVGGLYGVSLGGAFFGESMFTRVRDASKICLVHLVERLRQRNYELLDTQATTSHLRRFGAIDIPASEYLHRLRKAVTKDCHFA